MAATYEESVDWIHARLKFGIKPGLKRMEWMLERLGHPERRLMGIHVAGTNGKGSTVCFIRNILNEAGYKVGTFTSPYFEFFNERISVDGNPIKDSEILELVNIVQPLADELDNTELGGPTEFEIITAMAFYYFGRINPVDFAVFETGLGGRLDSTNVILPLLSVITNIGFDHTSILGETLQEIAFEKAGIIKPGVPVITTVEQPEALAVIQEKALSMKAPMYLQGKEFSYSHLDTGSTGELFSVQTPFKEYENLRISMKGPHQVKNAALAVMAADFLRTFYSALIEEDAVKEGLYKAYWAGRFEQLSSNPDIIIDGAHNPDGIMTLVNTVRQQYPGKKVHIIFCALSDKKLDDMVGPLAETAETITFTSFDFPRASTAKELFELCPGDHKFFDEDWKSAIDSRLSAIGPDEVLVVAGSLYFLPEARSYIKNKNI